MFAFFVSEGMQSFYLNIFSYPTLVFTALFVLSLVFWLVAILGLIDLDFLNIDLPEVDGDIEHVNVLAGLLMRFGLNGIPVNVILTFLAAFGWVICYYSVHFLLNLLEPGFLKFGLATVILLVSFYLAAMLTAVVIKPFRRFFNHGTTEGKKHILGQVLVVRTSRVDDTFGEATLADGGAGLILKVRSETQFTKGDRVVPIEYIDDKNVYRVIAEDEFLGHS
jgi:hypothetical protein